MNNKRTLIITALATFCLTASIFAILPTQSAYDPWLDYNEDGYIGIDDIFSTASEFGAEGDPTKNVNVTNFPLDEYGNLKVAYSPHLLHGSHTEVITIFSTESHFHATNDYYIGGVNLDYTTNVFAFNPLNTPYNITNLYLQVTIFPDRSGAFTGQYYNTTINGNCQITPEFASSYSRNHLVCTSINLTNTAIMDSIMEGMNLLEIYGSGEYSGLWYTLRAYKILLFVEYDF